MYPPVSDPSGLDADRPGQWTYAMRVDTAARAHESPAHQHRMSQLVLCLEGGVTCTVPQGIWMVPPRCAVWIPGGVPHCNHVTRNGQVNFLFVPAEAPGMPATCQTLGVTPLVREMVVHLAALSAKDSAAPGNRRLADVLVEQLARLEPEPLHLPLPAHPRLREIADALAARPDDRATLADWGRRVAMSERTLARLVRQEVGMSFGRWRQRLHIILALQWLSEGLSVQRSADQLGYESVSAFITMFRKALGTTPARYFAPATMNRRGNGSSTVPSDRAG